MKDTEAPLYCMESVTGWFWSLCFLFLFYFFFLCFWICLQQREGQVAAICMQCNRAYIRNLINCRSLHCNIPETWWGIVFVTWIVLGFLYTMNILLSLVNRMSKTIKAVLCIMSFLVHGSVLSCSPVLELVRPAWFVLGGCVCLFSCLATQL